MYRSDEIIDRFSTFSETDGSQVGLIGGATSTEWEWKKKSEIISDLNASLPHQIQSVQSQTDCTVEITVQRQTASANQKIETQPSDGWMVQESQSDSSVWIKRVVKRYELKQQKREEKKNRNEPDVIGSEKLKNRKIKYNHDKNKQERRMKEGQC